MNNSLFIYSFVLSTWVESESSTLHHPSPEAEVNVYKSSICPPFFSHSLCHKITSIDYTIQEHFMTCQLSCLFILNPKTMKKCQKSAKYHERNPKTSVFTNLTWPDSHGVNRSESKMGRMALSEASTSASGERCPQTDHYLLLCKERQPQLKNALHNQAWILLKRF